MKNMELRQHVIFFYKNQKNSLEDISCKWKGEFKANSKWLKFAFHGYDKDTCYQEVGYDKTKRDYQMIRKEAVRLHQSITGVILAEYIICRK